MPSPEELDDSDPADQGFDGDNDLPVDKQGERELPPRLTIVGTTVTAGSANAFRAGFMIRCLFVVGALVWVAACGGASSSVLAPTQAVNAAPVTPAVPTGVPPDPRSAPSFAGIWAGDFTVTGCIAGPFVATTRMCSDQFALGTLLPLRMQLWQAQDGVTGLLWLTAASQASGTYTQTYAGSLVGSFMGEGLSVQGSMEGTTIERNGFSYRVLLRSGSLTAVGAAEWTLDFRQDGVAGMGTVTIAAAGLTRVPS